MAEKRYPIVTEGEYEEDGGDMSMPYESYVYEQTKCREIFLAGYASHPPASVGMEEAVKEYGKAILKSISDTFLKPENLKKASLNDQAVIQAVGETILTFPLPDFTPSTPPAKDNWIKEKPADDREFAFITATWIKGRWDYNFWELIEANGYFNLCTQDGEEWGPYEDLAADQYYILPTPPTK